MTRTSSIHAILLALVCFFTFFVNNDTLLTDIMECRNIVTAREMVYDGHWMVPTMNGELRLEKPPLPTWMAAAAEQLCPGSLGAQRAVAGLGALLLVWFFYRTAHRLTGNRRYALVASLVLCTCHSVVLMGRTATWDIWCHAFMTGAICHLTALLRSESHALRHGLVCGLLAGLSFLSKGPVSFYALLLPFLLTYGAIFRPTLRGKAVPLLAAVAVTVAVGGWWYAFLLLFHTDEASQVFGKESASWVNRNVRPWYYYATFFLESGVWALTLLGTLATGFWKKRVAARQTYVFVVAWMVCMVVMLSFFPEKKNRYLLPVLIPASYAIGFLIDYWGQTLRRGCQAPQTDRLLFRIQGLLPALAVCGLPIAAALLFKGDGGPALPLAQTVLLCGIGIALAYTAVTLRPYAWLAGIVCLFVAVEATCMPLIGRWVNNPGYHGLAYLSQRPEAAALPYRHDAAQPLRIEMVYEAGRPIRPITADGASMEAAAPFVLLTNDESASLPATLLQRLDTLQLGTYDNNRRAGRHFRKDFVYKAILITKKKTK